jgi:hypothetical protein
MKGSSRSLENVGGQPRDLMFYVPSHIGNRTFSHLKGHRILERPEERIFDVVGLAR